MCAAAAVAVIVGAAVAVAIAVASFNVRANREHCPYALRASLFFYFIIFNL